MPANSPPDKDGWPNAVEANPDSNVPLESDTTHISLPLDWDNFGKSWTRRVIATLFDMMFVVDRASRVIAHEQFNPETPFFLPRDAFMNKPYREFLSPEVADQIDRLLDRVYSGQVSVQDEYLIAAGEIHYWYSATVSPYMGEEGEILGVVALVRDVTAHKHSQRLMRESEERFKNAFEYSGIGMALVSTGGRWLRVNQCLTETFGYSTSEMLDLDFQTITHPDDLDADLEMVGQMLRGEIDHYHLEKRYFHKDGHLIWALLTVSLVRDEQGQPLYFISQIQDITEEKQATHKLEDANRLLEATVEQLQQANGEVRQFAYIMSHDFRSPLANLAGFSHILSGASATVREITKTVAPHLDDAQTQALDEALEQQIPTALHYIDSAVQRLDHYTAAILKLSRIGHQHLNLEVVSSRAVVQAVIDSLSAQINEQGIEVTVDDLPDVRADSMALDQIFGNVLANAVNYLHPQRPGVIRIFAEAADHQVIFHVQDNGIGIPQAEYDKVFQPFRRIGAANHAGEGMGLAYVQALVRRHGGRMWFESAVGEGTRFSFSIPQRETPSQTS